MFPPFHSFVEPVKPFKSLRKFVIFSLVVFGLGVFVDSSVEVRHFVENNQTGSNSGDGENSLETEGAFDFGLEADFVGVSDFVLGLTFPYVAKGQRRDDGGKLDRTFIIRTHYLSFFPLDFFDAPRNLLPFLFV